MENKETNRIVLCEMKSETNEGNIKLNKRNGKIKHRYGKCLRALNERRT